MSNIIDGIDYGMGYEKATEWHKDAQWWSSESGKWLERLWRESPLTPSINYRRPLPIISQHPGAIPLELGEEIKDGETYLMRNGNPFAYTEDHELYWEDNGKHVVNKKFDFIARLPKVEQKEPDKAIYPCDKCGAMRTKEQGGQIFTVCDKCWEPEKAKEEKVEQRKLILDTWTVESAAELLLQLQAEPLVIAEVERQRKEKEIKAGDWFQDQFGTVDKCRGIQQGSYMGLSGMFYRHAKKIHDPAFIALLEKGVGNG